MSLSLSKLLGEVAYGITLGVARAWFEERRRHATILSEEITDEDVDRARRVAAAIRRMREGRPSNP